MQMLLQCSECHLNVGNVYVKPSRTGNSADETPLWLGRYWLDPTRSIPTNRNLPLWMGHLCRQDKRHLVQSRLV
uniref:Uncharacterized protein n=1 Tax=Strigamia maritima TaxID=126957 RepID=T1IUV3_STRMM